MLGRARCWGVSHLVCTIEVSGQPNLEASVQAPAGEKPRKT